MAKLSKRLVSGNDHAQISIGSSIFFAPIADGAVPGARCARASCARAELRGSSGAARPGHSAAARTATQLEPVRTAWQFELRGSSRDMYSVQGFVEWWVGVCGTVEA